MIALAAVFLARRSSPTTADDPAPPASTTETFGIVTSGEGKATGTPDQSAFTASVSTPSRHQAAMEADQLRYPCWRHPAAKKAGVAAKDIHHHEPTIRAKYHYSGKGRGKLVGYTLSERVRIMVRKLDKAGKTVGDAHKAAGSNP